MKIPTLYKFFFFQCADPSAVCGARVDYLFFDATADGLPFLASGPHFSIFLATIENDGPQKKKIGGGSDMSTDTKRRKEQSAAVGSAGGRFLRVQRKMDYLF